MNRKVTSAVALSIGLVLASASAIAEKNGCDRSQHAAHQNSMQTIHNTHMGTLRTALQLTPAQETAWTAFTEKIKSTNFAPENDMDWKGMTVPDRMDKMLENMKSREARMAERAAAVRQFYVNLSGDQRQIFDKQFPHRDRSHMRRALYDITN